MGTVIAVNGKGGTGKTTVSALLLRHLIRNKSGSVLAVDADPNSNLPDLLGIKGHQSIVGTIEEISKNIDKIPGGMTKERYIELRVQESLVEESGFDMLVMGRPEGPGCYCYVNNLLREIISRVTKNYDFVIIDNAAGMEHISRRTERAIDKFILVSDDSIFGVRSAKRIYELAMELKIKIGSAVLVINKTSGSGEPLDDEIRDTGLDLAGSILYDKDLYNIGVFGGTIFDLKDQKAEELIAAVSSKIFKCEGNVCKSN